MAFRDAYLAALGRQTSAKATLARQLHMCQIIFPSLQRMPLQFEQLQGILHFVDTWTDIFEIA